MSPINTPLPEPTHAEVIRRLDAIASTVGEMREEMRTTYVRVDVHSVVHDALDRRLDEKADRDVVDAIRAELAEQHDLRRKLMLAAWGLGLSNVVALGAAIVQHLSS